MTSDLQAQLRDYFTYVDEQQGAVDFMVGQRHQLDQVETLGTARPHQATRSDRPLSTWLAVAATLLIAGSLAGIWVWDDTEPGTAANGADGTIVFEAQDREANRYTDIYVMDADGSRTIQLTDHPGPDGNPSWSPDGSRIVFDSNRAAVGEDYGIYVMNSDGTRVTRIGTGTSPQWSPVGDRVLFQTGDGVSVMDSDGSNVVNVVDGQWPAWSSDGSQIIYSRPTPSVEGLARYDLYVIDVDGSNETQLTDTPNRDEFLGSSAPDGTRIAYLTDLDHWELHVMDADGSNDRRVPGGGLFSQALWSPDGRFLAYIKPILRGDAVPQSNGLVVLDATTLEVVKELTTEPEFLESASWKP